MFGGNKYAYIDDPSILRIKKPRRRMLPPLPDLSNFSTTSTSLKVKANFLMEIMKFLSPDEAIIYGEGRFVREIEGAEAGEGPVTIFEEEGVVRFVHSGVEWFTRDYWEAFNEEGITPGEIDTYDDYACFRGDGDQTRLVDLTGDGRITNADNVLWWEENHPGEDGFTQCRENWIAGQHHCAESFGRSGSGANTGASFKNLDFYGVASKFNYIRYPKSDEYDSSAIEDKAYFINDILSGMGFTWSDVTDLLGSDKIWNGGVEIDNPLKGKSYYDIVMSKAYESLDARNATLMTAAFRESYERIQDGMRTAFGREYAMQFIMENNPYRNHHALSLFPFFLYIQHSFQNQVIKFFEKAKDDGGGLSLKNNLHFWDFAEWSGRETYNGDGSGGMLYDFRDKFDSDSAAYNAVDDLIERWFGATDREDELRGEGYSDTYVSNVLGTYLKYGQGLDHVKVHERSSKRRANNFEFKEDTGDWEERFEEIQNEEAQKQRGAARSRMKDKRLKKMQLKKAQQKAMNKRKKAGKMMPNSSKRMPARQKAARDAKRK